MDHNEALGLIIAAMLEAGGWLLAALGALAWCLALQSALPLIPALVFAIWRTMVWRNHLRRIQTRGKNV